MSVSSHLSPEPERRLLIILDRMTHAAEWVEVKIGAITAFAAAELAYLNVAASPGPAPPKWPCWRTGSKP